MEKIHFFEKVLFGTISILCKKTLHFLLCEYYAKKTATPLPHDVTVFSLLHSVRLRRQKIMIPINSHALFRAEYANATASSRRTVSGALSFSCPQSLPISLTLSISCCVPFINLIKILIYLLSRSVIKCSRAA